MMIKTQIVRYDELTLKTHSLPITTSGREIAVWCGISPYHETGSLTSCPANEGVLVVSKLSQ